MSSKSSRKPPTKIRVESSLGKLTLDPASDWDSLTVAATDDRRSSVQLSVLSEDSRPQSLFADEDVDQDESEVLSAPEDEEDKWKKRQDETLADRTRPSMVVSKDVKEALEVLKKTPEMKNASTLFQQAKFLMQRSRYKEAVAFIDRALTADKDNKEWLTEKSRCYLNLLQPQKALEWINEVLNQDSKFFKALVQKGEILYTLCDFEKCVQCFVEGIRLRPENAECLQGIHKGRMALEEIAAHRFPPNRRKRRSKKRSKAAKGRPSSTNTGDCMPSLQLSSKPSLNTSTRPPATRPTTAAERNRRSDISWTSKPIDLEWNKFTDDPESLIGSSTLSRPKTSVIRRGTRSRSNNRGGGDIDKIGEESLSSSHRSTSLKCLSETSNTSRHSSLASLFSSMPGMSKNESLDRLEKFPLLRQETNEVVGQKKQAKLKMKISDSLARDKMFLESLLKDKDLKRSRTPHTKRVLRMAREVQAFVSERERFWKDRETFVRSAKESSDEETSI